MRVLFDDLLLVHHGTVTLEPRGGNALEHPVEARGGQANGLCGVGVPGSLVLTTGLDTGDVPLRIEVHDAAPPLEDVWEDVVEASFTVRAQPYQLAVHDQVLGLVPPAPGDHRARWCGRGMDAGDRMGVPDDGEVAPDRYLLQIWPAPPGPDVVVRQTSAIAAYWHEVAGRTAPLPPPASPEEVARAAADARAREAEAHAAGWTALTARLEVGRWGGRPPTDEQRGWGPGAAELARADRALLDDVAALPPAQQRELATWAAGRACEAAGLLDRPWVADALDRVRRGAPLPDVWHDGSAVWDLAFGAAHVPSLRVETRTAAPSDVAIVGGEEEEDDDGGRRPGARAVEDLALPGDPGVPEGLALPGDPGVPEDLALPGGLAVPGDLVPAVDDREQIPVAPEVIAIDAVRGAADPVPGAAASRAVAALSRGSGELGGLLMEARSVLRALTRP